MNHDIIDAGPVPDPAKKQLTLIIYVLYACSFIVGITSIAAIIVNYIKQDEVRGTWLESHFRWQIRTFWYSVLWSVLGFITTFILIGWLVLFATAIWFIYRLVRGILNLVDNKPMDIA